MLSGMILRHGICHSLPIMEYCPAQSLKYFTYQPESKSIKQAFTKLLIVIHVTYSSPGYPSIIHGQVSFRPGVIFDIASLKNTHKLFTFIPRT
jgi:hypothetical protein